MNDFVGFEKEIIEKLKSSGLIEKFSTYELEQTPNLQTIIKLFEEPTMLDFDDYGLYYFDDDNQKQYCPEMYSSISEKGEWLSDYIPNIDFDINQNGNVRKADEAEALFCCIVVSRIIKEESFRIEVKEIAKNYNFIDLKEIGNDGNSYRNLLTSWLDLQSEIINIIVSACKFKISDFKKDIEKFLRDGISESEAAELRDLESKIRSVNFEYSEGVLSPVNIKDLDKISRLKLIDEVACVNLMCGIRIGLVKDTK